MGRLIPATRAVTSLTRSGARYGLDGIGGAAGLAVAHALRFFKSWGDTGVTLCVTGVTLSGRKG